MARAPFQVLVLPFLLDRGEPVYGLFRRNRATGGYWQGIAGGGEDDETPAEAARREAFEEAGIPADARLVELASMTTMPVVNVSGFRWGPDVLVIPEYAFGLELSRRDLRLSDEHDELVWEPFERALDMLKWDSNRSALWELHHRIGNGMVRYL